MQEKHEAVRTEAEGAETAPEKSSQRQAENLKTEAFERLIRGEYKAEFDERVKKIIEKRFREMRGMKEQAARVKPLIDALSQKYGETDAQRLLELLSEDAAGRAPGSDKKRMALMRALEWHRDAGRLKREIPDFDFRREMGGKPFSNLLKAGVDMKTAYEFAHYRENLEAAVRYAAEKAREHTLLEMRKNAMRPGENGAGGQGGMRMSPMSVRNMTREQREEIERRSQRGEKVYLSE